MYIYKTDKEISLVELKNKRFITDTNYAFVKLNNNVICILGKRIKVELLKMKPIIKIIEKNNDILQKQGLVLLMHRLPNISKEVIKEYHVNILHDENIDINREYPIYKLK